MLTNIQTIVLYGLLYLHTAVFVLLLLAASFIAPKAWLALLIKIWARGIFVIIGSNFRVYGRENIPTGQKFMILTNHASLFDIPAIMVEFSDVAWLGKEYLTRIPVFSHALKKMNFVAVGNSPADSVRAIIRSSVANSEKFVVALFPEGTRTTNGQLLPFKRGFIHIMNGGDLDILPVYLRGLFDLKPKTRFTIRPGQPVDMIIGRPIKRAALAGLTAEEIVTRVQDVFMAHNH